MPTRAGTVFDWDRALWLYQRGWKYQDIATKFGCSYAAVQAALKKRGAHPTIRKHERTRSPRGRWLHRLWLRLRRRCERPTSEGYSRFGARGIRFVPAWDVFDVFHDWAIATGYREGLDLDRIDRDGNFSPENCRWVERGGLKSGTRGYSRTLIEAFGERKNCAEWSRDPRCRVGAERLRERLWAGWPPEEALVVQRWAKPSRLIAPVLVREPQRPKRRADWQRAVDLYCQGLSAEQIARDLGVTRATIVRGLRLRGVVKRRPGLTEAALERERLEHTWSNVHARCNNPHDLQYAANGGRGAHVAPEWSEFEPFFAWAKAHGARPGLWLVRKDVFGHWSPDNCEWIEPALARRRERPHAMPPPKRLVTAFGETKGVAEWGKDPRCKVRDFTISRRLDKGWKPEDAVAGPPLKLGTGKTRQLVLLRAFGEEKSKREWLVDSRCAGVGHVALDLRLRQGWSVEDAISTPPWRHPRAQRAAGE